LAIYFSSKLFIPFRIRKIQNASKNALTNYTLAAILDAIGEKHVHKMLASGDQGQKKNFYLDRKQKAPQGILQGLWSKNVCSQGRNRKIKDNGSSTTGSGLVRQKLQKFQGGI
jgi:hypothetical protein